MNRFLYTMIMTMMSPLGIIGFIAYIVPVLRDRGKMALSSYESLNWRMLYHINGSRYDPTSLQLARGLPATNILFRNLVLRGTLWVCRFTDYLPTYVEYPPPDPTQINALIGARCHFYDNAILGHISAVNQVVILGAGWDSRAYGLLKNKDVKIFEVDTPATQTVKLDAIEKTGIDASHVTFVSCDLNRENWLDAITAYGFDPNKPTYILWEAVTMYIEEQAVHKTFQIISSLPSGSAVSFDVQTRGWYDDTDKGKLLGWIFKKFYGDPFKCGFTITSDFSDWMSEYLNKYQLVLKGARPLIEKEGEVPYVGLVFAVRP